MRGKQVNDRPTHNVAAETGFGTTASGRTLGRAVALPVLALAEAEVPSGTLQTGGGQIITDQNGNPILLGS